MTTESGFVFDAMAESYDNDFTDTAIGKAQRDLVWSYLSRTHLVRVGHRCLEMNAGTGIDAAHLADFGLNVVATDKSAGMTAFLRMRGANHHFQSENLSFDQLRTHFNGQEFDLLFSNFGGLNCVDRKELEVLIEDFARLLKPKGRLVMVIMSRSCLWERFYFTLKGKFGQARRRFRKAGFPFEYGGESSVIHYYNPRDIIQLSGDQWQLKGVEPVGMFVPPSYLNGFFEGKQALLGKLIGWERKYAGRLPVKWADHFIIDFERRG